MFKKVLSLTIVFIFICSVNCFALGGIEPNSPLNTPTVKKVVEPEIESKIEPEPQLQAITIDACGQKIDFNVQTIEFMTKRDIENLMVFISAIRGLPALENGIRCSICQKLWPNQFKKIEEPIKEGVEVGE